MTCSAKRFGDIENYSIYVVNGKMGLKGSPNGEQCQLVLTQPQYDIIYPFFNGFSVVKRGKYFGVINKCGEEVIPSNKYVYLHYEPKSYSICEYFYTKDENGKECYLDANNNPIIVKDSYESIKIKAANAGRIDYYDIIFFRFSRGVYIFQDGVKEYVYNNLKNRIVFQGKNVRVVNNNLIVAQDYYSKKYGIIDYEGNVLTPFIYDELLNSSSGDIDIPENLFEARKNGKVGFINCKGHIKIPFIYRFCGTFHDGFAWVTNDQGKTGLINKDGIIVEPLIHDNILFLSTSIVYIDNVTKYSQKYYVKDAPKDYVKQSSKHVRFDFYYYKGYVEVTTIDGKKGITLLRGDICIPAEYDEIIVMSDFSFTARVRLNGKWGILSLKNEIKQPFVFDYLNTIKGKTKGQWPNDWFIVGKNNKFGIMDDEYKECLPVIYDGIEYSKKYDCYVVRIGEKKAMVDFWNNIVVPFTSEDLLSYK